MLVSFEESFNKIPRSRTLGLAFKSAFSIVLFEYSRGPAKWLNYIICIVLLEYRRGSSSGSELNESEFPLSSF